MRLAFTLAAAAVLALAMPAGAHRHSQHVVVVDEYGLAFNFDASNKICWSNKCREKWHVRIARSESGFSKPLFEGYRRKVRKDGTVRYKARRRDGSLRISATFNENREAIAFKFKWRKYHKKMGLPLRRGVMRLEPI